MLRKKAVKMPEEDNLTLPHISKMLSNLFGKEGHLQSPSTSPDTMPIEQLFEAMKRRLEQVPTRNMKEIKQKIVKVWKKVSNHSHDNSI